MIWRRSWRWFGAGAWAFPCDPDLPSNQAMVVWDIASQPAAVLLTDAPITTGSSVRFAAVPQAAFAKDLDGGRHELWSGDGDFQQVLITGRSEGHDTPIAAIVPLDQHTQIRLDAVRRLWSRLIDRPAGAPVLQITAQQRRRFVLMLRALDGWQQHVSYRDLATILLDVHARTQGRDEWLASSTRAQIIRLVRDGVRRVKGGYRDLLCGH